MGLVLNGTSYDNAALNGKVISGAAYNGQIVYESFHGPQYAKLRDKQIKRIAYLQDFISTGAIPVDPAYTADMGYYVNPYFACTAARAFLLNEEYYPRCRKFLQWCVDGFRTDNANDNTPFTIPDYYVKADGTMTIRTIDGSTCDSVDSYTAMFMFLLNEYCQKTGDKTIYTDNKTKIDSIANVLLNYRDTTTLTPAKLSYLIHYCMDNSEVYAGYNAMAKLYTLVGNTTKAGDYNYAATVVLGGIENKLWSAGGNYDVAIEQATNIVGTFYPNVLCQIFPDLYDAVPPAITTSRLAVVTDKFAYYAPASMANQMVYWDVYPEFDKFPHCEVFYWTCRNMQRYNGTWDMKGLDPYQMFDSINTRIKLSYDYIYCADSGWIALACDILDKVGG